VVGSQLARSRNEKIVGLPAPCPRTNSPACRRYRSSLRRLIRSGSTLLATRIGKKHLAGNRCRQALDGPFQISLINFLPFLEKKKDLSSSILSSAYLLCSVFCLSIAHLRCLFSFGSAEFPQIFLSHLFSPFFSAVFHSLFLSVFASVFARFLG